MTNLRRRHLLSMSMPAAALLAMPYARANATRQRWVLGQTAAMTGPLAGLATDALAGARIALSEVNASGGISGLPLEILALDDGYQPEQAVKNVVDLAGNEEVVALFQCGATPTNLAIAPKLPSLGLLHVAPFTGSGALRALAPGYILHMRASYGQEVTALISHQITVGHRRVGVIAQAGGYGDEVSKASRTALAAAGTEPAAVVPIRTDGADAATAVATLLKARPNSVLLGTAGKATASAVTEFRRQAPGLPLYGLSVLGHKDSLRALGAAGVGIVMSQVLPHPWTSQMELASQYRAASAKDGTHTMSYVGFEGYAAARLTASLLRNATARVSRASIQARGAALKPFELAGLRLHYGSPEANGSKFVELVMVGEGERLVR